MNLVTRFCSGVLFPLHERLKGHTSVQIRRRLEQSQWWSRDTLARYQTERLRAFLCSIGNRVPYYRELFRSIRFVPSTVTSARDLEALPRLGKAEIRANVDALRALGARGLNAYNTGGSSGEPLRFYTSNERRSHDVAAKWRATRWWNVDIGDPEIVVWGSPIELNAQDRLREMRDRLMRSVLLPAFDMSESNLDRFIAVIRSRRPAMLFGYPSSLSVIALHARKRSVDMSDLGIKVAFVTSERLYDDQREIISSVFGCPVANGYGGRDAGFIAHECPSGSMHISAEDIIVEVLDPEGHRVADGETGEIVVTHLSTEDFPFVRYCTGDMGILGTKQCACGRGLPVLEQIHGRSTDFVMKSDGTLVHGLALIYVLRALPGVERFKIVQHDALRIEVLVVCSADFPAGAEQRIAADFRKRLGSTVEVDVTRVSAIAAEASGKYRYVVSHAVAAAVATPASSAARIPRGGARRHA